MWFYLGRAIPPILFSPPSYLKLVFDYRLKINYRLNQDECPFFEKLPVPFHIQVFIGGGGGSGLVPEYLRFSSMS